MADIEQNNTNEIIIDMTNTKRSAADRFFGLTERKAKIASEIGAGFGAFCIAVCALLMNTQIIGQVYGSYAGAYLATALVALLGTVLLGLVCRLPLLQSANMGLSAVLISMLSAHEGLSYANLMLVTFAAAAVYLAIVLTPAAKLLIDRIPSGVAKAMPVGLGILVMQTALANSGIMSNGAIAKVSSFTTLNRYYFWLMFAGLLIFTLLKAFNRRKSATVTFWCLIGAMWIGGIVFYLDYFIGGQTAATIVYERLNLVFATDGAAPYNISHAIANLKIGTLFTEGADFSAFTAAGGSVPMLFIKGILSFLMLGLYSNLATARAAAVTGDYADAEHAAKGEKKALIVGAVMNLLAPVLGSAPTTIGVQSAVGTHDRGRTGLTAVSASVGYLIAVFSWIFIMLFATGTHGVGMWIDDTEIKLAAYVKDTFMFADLIMIFMGAAMLKGIGKVNTADICEMLPFAAAVAVIGIAGDIALGVAIGCVCGLIVKVISPERKSLSVSDIILAVIMLIYTVIALL